MTRTITLSTEMPSFVDERPALPSGCSWQDDGSVLMVLNRPVSFSETSGAGKREVEVADLVFQELTAGDLIDSSEYRTSGTRTLFLLCASTGRRGPAGENLLRGMTARDYKKAVGIIDVFISDGPQTGTSV
ncbi:hypothetical protein AD945_01760 [Gluconobacter albidus]|uniref:Uncharacterized protein n=1 Tax=Gluconobacter albidus TaxID=318683 RepID=A0A149TMV0_9PROT|nr:hypothetical protein [Gluconobacter albidus]KXV50534.1 hypothetical protein AD945_01760 [Gluconobacter albidus]